LNFNGLGLPSALFDEFSNLLSISTDGEAHCYNDEIGLCVFDYSCSEIDDNLDLWD
jgi:hypothetical protein